MFEWFFFVCGTFAVTIIKILEIPFTVFFRCTRANNYWSKVLFIQCCFGHRKVSQLNQNVEKKDRQLKAFKQSSTLEQTPFHGASIQCIKLSKLVYWCCDAMQCFVQIVLQRIACDTGISDVVSHFATKRKVANPNKRSVDYYSFTGSQTLN